MTPILFEKDTRNFTGGGICRLAEATAWSVKEVLNAEYELEMSYPAAGEHFAEIKTERIIYAKPNPTDEPQAFIIYAVSKPLRGKVQIYAEHVSYRQNKITVAPFHAKNIKEALTAVQNAVVGESPFTFTTSMEVINDINSNVPRTLRNSIHGRIISLYGGEIKYNNYSAEILPRRGSNKGFTVRYGKNLLDFNQEEDISAVYDAVYPYYFVQDLEDEEDFTYVELPEKIIKIGTTQEKVMPLNLTADFQEEPDEEELREAAQKYLKENDINKGVLSVTLDFAILSETEEYKNSMPPERVELGDDVAVYIPKRGVTVRSRIIKTIYDGKKGRFSSVTVGEIETDIADTMVTIKNDLAGVQSKIVSSQKSIAMLNVTADDQAAQIKGLVQWIEDNEGDIQNIAEIEAKVDEQGAKIGLVVETTDGGENVVRGGVLVEAINGQSTAKISADVLDIEGKTLNIKVDATNIKGELIADQINADGLKVTNGEINNCVINENCEILGKLMSNTISARETTAKSAAISYEQEGSDFEGYNISFLGQFVNGVAQTGAYLRLGEIFDSHSVIIYSYDYEAESYIGIEPWGMYVQCPSITLDGKEYGLVNELLGEWEYNGSELATKADLEQLSNRISSLGG